MAEEKQTKSTEKNYPRIIGGICEFCGIKAEECLHYKKLFAEKKFRCLCGNSNNPDSFNQSIYLYVPEWKTWICNSLGCRSQVEAKGGLASPQIYEFYFR